MNKTRLPLGAALLLALLLNGCESDGGISARSQEKSAVYAALKPWQKKYIDKGTITNGFSPDMVYIALGKPDKVESKDQADHQVQLWTYSRFYPNDAASMRGFQRANFTTESAYQPQLATTQGAGNTPGGHAIPLGMSTAGAESIGKTGGPQGGSMEPANLTSYTIQVLFENGLVNKMSATPNMN